MDAVKAQLRDDLSFITITYSRRGKPLSTDFFDVPEQTYGDGWSTGMEVAAQLMDALRKARGGFDVLSVIEAAAESAAAGRGHDPDALDRRGAAVGFLRMIEAVLWEASKSTDFGAWIREERDAHDRRQSEFLEQQRLRRQARGREFTERMRAAKAARRASGINATN